jgi:hypothetical protein
MSVCSFEFDDNGEYDAYSCSKRFDVFVARRKAKCTVCGDEIPRGKLYYREWVYWYNNGPKNETICACMWCANAFWESDGLADIAFTISPDEEMLCEVEGLSDSGIAEERDRIMSKGPDYVREFSRRFRHVAEALGLEACQVRCHAHDCGGMLRSSPTIGGCHERVFQLFPFPPP